MDNLVEQLSQTCHIQQDEIDRLHRQLDALTKEEERRAIHHAQIIQQFRRRASRVHNVLDSKLLDVIDSYETQLSQLQKQQRHSKRLPCGHKEVIKSLQTTLEDCEQQLAEKNIEIKQLRDKVELLNLELESRPQLQTVRTLQKGLKQLQRRNSNLEANKNVNQSVSLDDSLLEPVDNYNTSHASISSSQKCLQSICSILKEDDLNEVINIVSQQRELVSESLLYYEFAKDVTNLIQQKTGKDVSLDGALGYVKKSLGDVKKLQKNKDEEDVEELINVIQHIQNLFDVKDIPKLYTKMNHVYNRLSELNNVFNTLRELLSLPESCSCHMIVDGVEVIISANQSHLRNLFSGHDINSVIEKLEEHSTLLPQYQNVIEKIMDWFNLKSFDEVLPTVRVLAYTQPSYLRPTDPT